MSRSPVVVMTLSRTSVRSLTWRSVDGSVAFVNRASTDDALFSDDTNRSRSARWFARISVASAVDEIARATTSVLPATVEIALLRLSIAVARSGARFARTGVICRSSLKICPSSVPLSFRICADEWITVARSAVVPPCSSRPSEMSASSRPGIRLVRSRGMTSPFCSGCGEGVSLEGARSSMNSSPRSDVERISASALRGMRASLLTRSVTRAL